MAEYLEREALLKSLTQECKDCDNNFGYDCEECDYAHAMLYVKAEKAADVQPVKRGRWDFQGYQLFKCTNCKEMFTQDQLEAMQNHKDCEEWTFPNFCPNCGARMDGDTE
jgi:hypothetical protein